MSAVADGRRDALPSPATRRVDQHCRRHITVRIVVPRPSVTLELVAGDAATTHLEIVAEAPAGPSGNLQEQVLACLVAGNELTRARLRDLLSVQNQRLGEALQTLERAGKIRHSAAGWQRVG